MQILDPKRIEGEKEITVNLTEGCFFFFSALNSEYKLNQTVKLDICLVTILHGLCLLHFWCLLCYHKRTAKSDFLRFYFLGYFLGNFDGIDLIIG